MSGRGVKPGIEERWMEPMFLEDESGESSGFRMVAEP
jgi:hypothetical protein